MAAENGEKGKYAITNSTGFGKCRTVSSFQYLQSDPPTNKSLSALIIQLLQFQEDNLGKNVQKPPMTRIPVSFVNKTKFVFLIQSKVSNGDSPCCFQKTMRCRVFQRNMQYRSCEVTKKNHDYNCATMKTICYRSSISWTSNQVEHFVTCWPQLTNTRANKVGVNSRCKLGRYS